jgi:hypothetical protein
MAFSVRLDGKTEAAYPTPNHKDRKASLRRAFEVNLASHFGKRVAFVGVYSVVKLSLVSKLSTC